MLAWRAKLRGLSAIRLPFGRNGDGEAAFQSPKIMELAILTVIRGGRNSSSGRKNSCWKMVCGKHRETRATGILFVISVFSLEATSQYDGRQSSGDLSGLTIQSQRFPLEDLQC